MFNSFRFRRDRRNAARARRPFVPRLEGLEDRCCPSGGYLLVGSYDNNSVLRYDESTGAFVDQFDPHNLGNLINPSGGVFGPDGNLYVSSGIFPHNNSGIFAHNNPQVLQYNGTTGAFQSVFANQNVTSPRGLLFGPDGNLLVADGNDPASGDPASVERFDGKTGAFLNYFVTPSSGGLQHPSGMVFGPDGTNDGKLDLYVGVGHLGAAGDQGAIYRYDGTTGAFKGVFVSAGSGGLSGPGPQVFGADGNLYVANFRNGPPSGGEFPAGDVLEFEGPSGPNPGVFLGTFVAGGSGGLANPNAILFGPDPSGNGHTDLYVATCQLSSTKTEPNTSQVLRYDATTGAFLGTFVTPDSGGLRFPTFLAFTETDPTTLNYDGTTTSATASVPAAPASHAASTRSAAPQAPNRLSMGQPTLRASPPLGLAPPSAPRTSPTVVPPSASTIATVPPRAADAVVAAAQQTTIEDATGLLAPANPTLGLAPPPTPRPSPTAMPETADTTAAVRAQAADAVFAAGTGNYDRRWRRLFAPLASSSLEAL
jgi:hypothetical protein